MTKINPLAYVTDIDPVPEAVLDASGWFETEYMTISFRWSFNSNSAWGPDEDGKIAWFMAQGWVVYDKKEVDIGGFGDVYEYTYSLKRRKLQSERVLQSMITDFTAAYNEGRSINDQRYDEIVLIFNSMLDKSGDFLTSQESALAAFLTSSNLLLDPLASDYSTYEVAVNATISDYQDTSDKLKEISDSIDAVLSLLTTASSETDASAAAINGLSSLVNTIASSLDASAAEIDEFFTKINLLATGLDTAAANLVAFDSEIPEDRASLASDVATDLTAFDLATANLDDGFANFADSAEAALNNYGDSIRSQINQRFDNESAKAKQNLVSKGLYSTTTWTSVSSGIERERSLALSDLEDKIIQQQLAVTNGVYDRRAALKRAALDAKGRRNAITASLHDQLFRYHDQKLRVQDSLARINSQRAQVESQRLAVHDQELKVSSVRMQLQGHIIAIHDQGLKIVEQRMRLHDQYLRASTANMNIRIAQMEASSHIVSLLGQLCDKNIDFKVKLTEAKNRIQDRVITGNLNIVQMRNAILTAMLGFMERRTDDYPGLDGLADIAAKLGYAEGGTVSPP